MNYIYKLAYISNKEVSIVFIKSDKSACLLFKCKAVFAFTGDLENAVKQVCKCACFAKSADWLKNTCNERKVLCKCAVVWINNIVYKTEDCIKPIFYKDTNESIENLCWIWVLSIWLEFSYLCVRNSGIGFTRYCNFFSFKFTVVAVCPCIFADTVLICSKVFHNIEELWNSNH